MLADNGALAELINAWSENFGMCSDLYWDGSSSLYRSGVLRTFNRNFRTQWYCHADVYLCSPEVAAVSALRGEITIPVFLEPIVVNQPERYLVNDNLIVPPLPFDEAEKEK